MVGDKSFCGGGAMAPERTLGTRSTSGNSAALKSQIRVFCRVPTLFQLGRSGEQRR